MTLTPDELRAMQTMYGWINAVLADGRVYATQLDALIKAQTRQPIMLSVPYVPQNDPMRADDDYSNSDCGPACVQMVIGWRGRVVPVDQVSMATGLPAGFKYTMPANLIVAAAKFDLALVHRFGLPTDQIGPLTLGLIRSEVDADRPVIVLVHYPSLPIRRDMTFTGGHYVVVTGYEPDTNAIIYHDPYWPDLAGANVRCSGEAFQSAMANCKLNGNRPYQGLTVRP